jgi:hypothetical protein
MNLIPNASGKTSKQKNRAPRVMIDGNKPMVTASPKAYCERLYFLAQSGETIIHALQCGHWNACESKIAGVSLMSRILTATERSRRHNGHLSLGINRIDPSLF